MTVLLEGQKIALKTFDEARRGIGQHLRSHSIDVAVSNAMDKVFAKIVVERGSTVPTRPEVISICVALAFACERTPNMRGQHGAGDELIGVSAGQQGLRSGISPRIE